MKLPRSTELRLQTKLALFGATLVLAGVGLTGLTGAWLIDRQAERAAQERLAAAEEFAVAEYESLITHARITGEVLAARLSPQLLSSPQAEFAPEEVASLASLVRGPRRIEAADSIALIARDGTVLVEVVRDGALSRGGHWTSDEAVAAALGGTPALGIDVFPEGGLRALAVLPVPPVATALSGDGSIAGQQPVVGAIAVTSFIDDEVAEWLHRITGAHVAFFAGDQRIAASRRVASDPSASAVLHRLAGVWPRLAAGESAKAEFGGPLQRVLVRYAPLHDPGGDVIGAVAVSARLELLGSARRETLALFAGIAGVVLALGLISNAYAARILSRPLARLVAVVRRIGAGDLATPVVCGATVPHVAAQRDEVAELATAVEDMRRQLAAAAASQAQLNRLKDEYLFSVAHELRSPLAALTGSVELLAEQDDLSSEERTHFVGIVQRHTAALRTLVDNLLDLGSLRAGRFSVEPRPTAVDVIVEEAVEDATPHLQARRQRVRRRIARPTPVVQADPRRLRQVLVNLLSNAAKYGPEGEEVEVVVEQRDSVVRFAVADRGPGIPPDERARLFDAYFRSTSTSRAAPGVGLGLAIVKAIVDAHHGRVGVESTPGMGTRFWVELPAAVVVPKGAYGTAPVSARA